ncbi:MAG: virulence RhuM family protein [Methanobrevibacter sp.]|nr:virulence RhuM family protein [Candidatus Methanovirga procula]
MSLELNKDDVSFNPNNSTNSGIPLINPQSTKQPILYNLDTIISIGYRVRDSKEATRFRIWTADS